MTVKDILPWRGGSPSFSSRPSAGEPDEQLAPIYRRMNSLFEEFVDRSLGLWGESGRFTPRVDLIEKDREIVVTAELPGLEGKDVEVMVEDSALILRGEKQQEQEEKEEGHYRIERSYGSFNRRIPLSSPIEREKVKASFRKGVLTVRLPKSAESGAGFRRVKIQS
jgi:HSP20 family protein